MATKSPAKAVKRAVEAPEEYRMPVEVADWIKQAESRIAYFTTTVNRLKEENAHLKRANRIMEQRVLGQSQE